MILELEGWILSVDTEHTRAYSDGECAVHCLCAPCRNFYASVDDAYPALRSFLDGFGVSVEAPDELIPYFPPTQCMAYYAVSGDILQAGNGPLYAGDLKIFPESCEEAMVNTFIEGPCFFLRTDLMELPWVLDEPMEDDSSPARRPEFLRRILTKFLK